MVTARAILEHAFELLQRPNGWVKGRTTAMHADGTEAYCAAGAIERAFVTLNAGVQPRLEALDLIQEAAPNQNIVGFNDLKSTKLDDVLEVFKKAIVSAPLD